jgi:hypothetical protein
MLGRLGRRMSTDVKAWKICVVVLMAVCGICFLALALGPAEAANRDFVSYWASGRLVLQHASPYDAQAILRLERGVGFGGERALMMRNPPTLLPAILPIGLLPERIGAIVWLIALGAALIFSVRALWILNGRSEDRFHLIAYLFPPAIACLFSGQIGLFLLASAMLFLMTVSRWPFLAGVALAAFSFKPHLYVPFLMVLLIWSALERRWRIVLGLICGFGALLMAGFAIDPHGWTQYAAMIRAEEIGGEFVPSLSLAFREIVAPRHSWVQVVPCILACIWAANEYWSRRDHWNWVEEAPFLLLVSVTMSPYSWFTDQSLALPAVAISLDRQASSSTVRAVYAVIAIAGMLVVFTHDQLNAPVFLLLSPLWLGFCIYARRMQQRSLAMSQQEGDRLLTRRDSR